MEYLASSKSSTVLIHGPRVFALIPAGSRELSSTVLWPRHLAAYLVAMQNSSVISHTILKLLRRVSHLPIPEDHDNECRVLAERANDRHRKKTLSMLSFVCSLSHIFTQSEARGATVVPPAPRQHILCERQNHDGPAKATVPDVAGTSKKKHQCAT